MPRKLSFFLFLFALPLIFISAVYLNANINKDFVEIRFGDKKITAEIAKDDITRTRGLSGRESLEENHGMLFLFGSRGYHGIWMKEMNFPIDILWIEDGRVVYLVKDASPEPGVPESELAVYTPDSPAEYVLELNSGMADELGISVGSEIQITF